MASITPVGLTYARPTELDSLLDNCADRVLACLGYGSADPFQRTRGVPIVWTGIPSLDAMRSYEVWVAAKPITRSQEDAISVRRDDEVLYAWIELAVSNPDRFEATVLDGYCRLLDAVDRHGYSHLLRMWHFIPEIHRTDGDLERYKRFCVARHDALISRNRAIERDAPAASAVGKPPGSVLISVLASVTPGQPLENPRQVSAYRYPKVYAPRGPAFARGLLTSWGGFDHLYVSGTASIVAHESRHAGDVASQADETIANLQAVMKAAAPYRPSKSWSNMAFKVYLRRPQDQTIVAERLASTFGVDASYLNVQAEICRQELLVEVEAACRAPRAQR